MKKIFLILYSLFLLFLTIFSYTFVDPNLIYLKSVYTGFAFDKRVFAGIFYILFIFLFFIFHISFFILAKKNKLTFNNLKFLIFTTTGILFLSYPAMLSFDIFNYIATAKVLYLYHENPYIIMPIEFVGDPMLLFMHAANKTALYGVSWLLLTSIPYVLGIGNFILTLFSFKLFVSFFYLGAILLIWKISKNKFSVILFALNPLVIIETLVSGHNDIVMMFLVLFSFFLVMKKKIWLAILFFISSIFIKYATLFLIPVFLYLLWKVYVKEKIAWDKIYLISFLLMFLAFISAPIREEIYPWYAIWFLTFVFLIPERKIIIYTSLAFSFSLLLRYIPFMLLGTYFDPTPQIKIIATFAPPITIFGYLFIKEKLWLKILHR